MLHTHAIPLRVGFIGFSARMNYSISLPSAISSALDWPQLMKMRGLNFVDQPNTLEAEVGTDPSQHCCPLGRIV
jgi:hypothetical protein